MHFQQSKIPGLYVIEVEPHKDHRGFFARSWCQREFSAHGLNPRIAQISVAFTAKKGGLRGLHYQLSPHWEAKTVRCTRGKIFDVAVDLRPDSPTFCQWVGFELSADNHRTLHIPEGCAHGYQTLEHESEIQYLTTEFYAPEAARGRRYNDPAFGITWPLPVAAISDADRSWPDFEGQP